LLALSAGRIPNVGEGETRIPGVEERSDFLLNKFFSPDFRAFNRFENQPVTERGDLRDNADRVDSKVPQ
jgi:hypothetical protein